MSGSVFHLELFSAQAELQLLILLASGARERAAIAALSERPIDLRRVAELAEFHGLTPHVRHALAQNPWIAAPSDAHDRLEAAFRRNVGNGLQLTGELLRLADSLDAANVRFAAFKGPALASLLYGDLSRRSYNDIDLIVDKRQRFAAEDVLAAHGYRARHGDRPYREAFQNYQCQYIFAKDTAMVDLHWDFVPARTPFPLSADEIWESLATVKIAGRELPTLGVDDQALLLAGHGTKEGWKSLSWIFDFADFAAANQDLDWIGLWRRAAARGQGRTLLLAGVLAAEVARAPVDERLLERAKGDPRVVARSRAIVLELSRPDAIARSHGHDNWRSFDLCETWRQRAGVLWAFIATRTVSDYEFLPLPRPLWRLYFLLRPFRVAAKAMFALPARLMSAFPFTRRPVRSPSAAPPRA